MRRHSFDPGIRFSLAISIGEKKYLLRGSFNTDKLGELFVMSEAGSLLIDDIFSLGYLRRNVPRTS